ncbi:MAG: hypothetical protein KAG14_04125, partial [Mycoplasmataceae bacterium]|nr:hypothetical protein [Mycoplasmataceae bacterium]
MHLQKNNPLKKILFLILIISILSGCSGLRSKYGSNKNDICYPHRDRVIQIQEKFNKDKWTDTAVGIGTGALLGAAIGAVTNGARGAVVGAIAGGITGGATGYARAKIKEASTKEQMLRTVNADIASN